MDALHFISRRGVMLYKRIVILKEDDVPIIMKANPTMQERIQNCYALPPS